MKIIILRHGKPVIPPLNRISPAAFPDWVTAYNNAGLSPTSTPTDEALSIAKKCNTVVCSHLARSIESASALGFTETTLNSALFNEAELPTVNLNHPRLSPKVWAVLLRILWLLGYSTNSESFKQAKIRASEAADTLIDLATHHSSVLFIGHGVYNRILVNELLARGWSGPKNPGTVHWSYGVYTYPSSTA